MNKLKYSLTLLIFCSFITTVYAVGFPDFTVLVEQNKAAVVNISTTTKNSRSLSSGRGYDEFNLPDPGNSQKFEELLRKYHEQYGGGNQRHQKFQKNAESLGSGFIISSDGYIVTNHHVIAEAKAIQVKLNDRREFKAELIGSDETSDIALLKINATDLPVVTLGSSGDLKQGEWVLAIGSPFGLDYSVSAGIVSAKGRSLPGENYVPYIQTDVAINPGNSGGPLFNMDGKVVGINSQIYSRSGGYMGLSFAIPVELMIKVVEQIKSTGRVSRGWLGVIFQEVTSDLAKTFGMSLPKGALISQVLENSPAEKAGLKAGDVILEFDDFPINKSADLPPVVGSTQAGSLSLVRVLRNGVEITLDITIEELPDDVSVAGTGKNSKEMEALGMKLRALTDKEKEEMAMDSGLLVVAVIDEPAVKAGIITGDILISLNNQKLETTKAFATIIKSLPEDRPSALLVKRGATSIFLTIQSR